MKTYVILFFCLSVTIRIAAQATRDELPMIGAEVFIEPGQKPEEIERWFQVLKESGMTVTRIRLTENYLRRPDGTWDFSLFDHAYAMGEKYNIRIYGNLFPATPFTNIGGFKFPSSAGHLDSISSYIKAAVSHFRDFKSCYGWVPINEPGSGMLPPDHYTQQQLQKWKTEHPVQNVKGYTPLDFSSERFLKEYNTWFLNWLTKEIRKYDSANPIHVNTHAIFNNAAEYDFPEWRKFLTSLGGSAHASWHFGYFTRNKYALAISANSEIIRSGAGSLPWLMTELQGGVTTYSGNIPMNPTPEEITQWLWLTVSSEGKGAIFWCLNPRSSGIEAGEWAMLDYKNLASERLVAASRVIKALNDNRDLFTSARVAESGINILYIRDALWNEAKQQTGNHYVEGRASGGVMKSALSYFEALSEMGVQANLKEIGEFDFSKSDYAGQSIVLAHQISLPSVYKDALYHFVRKGGRLLVDGLTAFYDENGVCLLNTGFPYEDLFGGYVTGYNVVNDDFGITIKGVRSALTGQLWKGSVKATTGEIVAFSGNEAVGIRNKFGSGEVIWIPSLIGLSARSDNDYSKLAMLLENVFADNLFQSPLRFAKPIPGLIMKVLQTNDSYVTVVVNKSGRRQKAALVLKEELEPEMLFHDNGSVKGKTILIEPEETIVVRWRKKSR